jgi:hypothetical protein
LARCGRSDPRGGRQPVDRDQQNTREGSPERKKAMSEALEAHERIKDAMRNRRTLN